MPVAGPCLINQLTNDQFEKQITPEERSQFWNYAKSLGASQGMDHATVISQMAKTFNMPERLMVQALDGPKTIRKASEVVKARQKASQRFMAENKRYLMKYDQTGGERLLSFLNDGTRSTLLKYHGPVPPVTHAIDVATTNPARFLQMYFRGFKAVSEKSYDHMMTKLEGEKYYQQFKDAGMPLGREAQEGFHKTGWAGRAMDSALGWLRYRLAADYMDSLPPEQRTPAMFKHAALEYSHATGALVKGEVAEVRTRSVRQLLLAPLLTPSKFMKSVFDPITTVKTFERMIESKVPGSKVRPPTPEERSIAYNRLKRAGTYMGVTLSALYANQQILKAIGANQTVNLTDPTRGDFLAFKFGGRQYRMRGSIEIAALFAKLATLGLQKYKYGQQTPEEALAKYSEYKLTPGIGLGKELLTGKDVFGRPVPWSKDIGSDKFPRKNVMEFVGEHGPIFIGHAVSALHESLRDQGVDTRTSMNVIRALTQNPGVAAKALEESMIGGVPEFFGVNIQPDRYVGRPPGAAPVSAKRIPGMPRAVEGHKPKAVH